MGSNPGTGSFFSSFLFLHFFPSFPYTALLPRCVCASVGRVLRVYLAGLLTIDFDHKHSSGRILDCNGTKGGYVGHFVFD